MAERDFDFYVGGIEDGIIAALQGMKQPPCGVRELTTYSGELDDAKALQSAIASEARVFPLVMVSYGGGHDTRSPATPSVLGKPLSYRHDCFFAVICADNDPRGERSRRRSSVYGMLSAVRRELTGRRLVTIDEDTDERVVLTHGVFEPDGTEYVLKLANMTAYVAVFRTWFNWSSPDRTVLGSDVAEIIVGVGDQSASPSNPGNVPGVNFETGD
ncbi:MAG TPA: DUF1834 family protein [Pyrinomonadaceae bacterium]|nr:DUF1834 family protein [Pyrinomonadaceae bacterium]